MERAEAVSLSDASTMQFVIVDVPCAECGYKVDCEVESPASGDLVVFCGDCRTEMLGSPTLPPGYDLVRTLGRGGMGAVFLARHRALGLDRAVKMILPHGAVSEEGRAQFLQEARVHARLSHPRIVQVHDLCEVRPGVFAIVMEYVAGTDAGELLRSRRPHGIDAPAAVTIAAQALEALAYVHGEGVVHCDVKDPNLLVLQTPALATKLGDFGLARTYALSGASSRRRADATSGTIPYMSPEQASCAPLGPASDIYSLGATLYRLLTGAYPHTFPVGRAALDVVRHDPVVPVQARRGDLSEALGSAVDRSLAHDPAERFHSADAMRRALLEAVP